MEWWGGGRVGDGWDDREGQIGNGWDWWNGGEVVWEDRT